MESGYRANLRFDEMPDDQFFSAAFDFHIPKKMYPGDEGREVRATYEWTGAGEYLAEGLAFGIHEGDQVVGEGVVGRVIS